MSKSQRYDDSDEISEELEHLITRDVQQVSFPDRIYALGGGGRKMVLELFKQDWFAIETMRGRDQDLDLIFMDSASENEENHADEVEELETNLEFLEQTLQEETDSAVDIGGIEIHDRLITDHVTITTRASLTGTDTIDDVLAHTNADYWWVKDEHLDATDNSGDFYDVSQGAVKRRALGKALHYKALANGGRAYRDSMYTAAEESSIAIFTGLGGGTGSGTFLDVAEMIRDRNPSATIDLFGTLPASGQRDQAQANAFAALSELEYQSLTREMIFNDMYLFPLEPTDLQSETTENPELREFDRAMSYAIMGIYNDADRDFAFASSSSYAPFTIVIPQVLRYNRDEIKRKKEEVHALLDTKREILNQEYYYFEQVEQYLDDQYPNATAVSGGELSDESREYLINRLREFEQLLTSDLLKKLEIEITDYSEQLLEDIYGDELDPSEDTLTEVIQRRGIDDIIGDINFTIERRDISGGRVDNYAEFGDEYVRDVVHTELHRLKEAFDILCRLRGAEKSAIDSSGSQVATDTDTKLLETLLVPSIDRGAEKKRWRSLDMAKDNTADKRKTLNSDIDEAEEKLRAEQADFEDAVEAYSDEFWASAEALITDLVTLESTNLDQEIQTLTAELEQFAEQVSNSGDVTQVRESEVLSTLSNVEQEVSADLRSGVGTAGGVDVSHLETEIRESLDIAKTLRRRWDDIENRSESGGILGRVLGSSSDGTIDSDRYRTPYQQLTEHAIFSAPRPPNQKSTVDRTEFSLEVTRDPAEELSDQVEQLKSDIRVELKNAYSELIDRVSEVSDNDKGGIAGTNTSTASTELQTEFNRVLEQTPPAALKTEISTLITETVEEQIDTEVDHYEQELERLKTEVEALDSKYSRLEAAHEVYEQITGQAEDPLRELHEEFQAGFSDEIFDLPHQRATRHAIENLYRHQVTPADLSSAVKCPSLAETSLLEPQPNSEVSQERQDIRKSFKRITSNRVLDNKYNGLERERLRTADVPTFDGTGVYVAYASEAIDTSSTGGAKLNPNDFEEIQQSLERNFHLDEPANQYDEWFVQNGDPWEVSMCVYVQGISFLDNLRDVIAMDGYWSKYQNLTKQRDETRTIERHAYGLEDGFYTVRSDLVDINANTEFYVEQSAEEIRSALLDKQKRVSLDDEAANVNLEEATTGGDE